MDLAMEKELNKGNDDQRVSHNENEEVGYNQLEREKIVNGPKRIIDGVITMTMNGSSRKSKQEGIQLGTWNVRSTFAAGALIRLTEVLKSQNVDLLAIQETKQAGIYIQEIGDYVIFNSGNENRIYGVGFVVNKKLKNEIVEFKPITERLCKIRIRTRYRKMSIINVHCPTEEKE